MRARKARNQRKKVLQDLSDEQLYELGVEYGVAISKGMSREEMINALSRCNRLTVRSIMKKGIQKSRRVDHIISRKKTEAVQVEHEVFRTEKSRQR